MDLQLKDKCAFIAGSSRGLGYATAATLAREGCRVVLNSRDERKVVAAAKKITDETGTQAYGLAGDVSDTSSAEKLITATVEALGRMYESIRLESDPVIAVVSSLLISAVLLGVLLSVLLRRKPANVP